MTGGPVRHGYTMHDIDRLARLSVHRDRTLASDGHYRHGIAFSAIAEAIFTAETPPTDQELVRTGWQAIYADIRAMNHIYGRRPDAGAVEVASMPRYVAFWFNPSHRFEDDVIDRLAVWQVLEELTETEREAVTSLAMHDDYAAAAAAIEVKYSAFTVRISSARRKLHKRWYEPGVPPQKRTTDRRVGSYRPAPAACPAGHEWTPENTRIGPKRGARRCRECERQRDQKRRKVKHAQSSGGGT